MIRQLLILLFKCLLLLVTILITVVLTSTLDESNESAEWPWTDHFFKLFVRDQNPIVVDRMDQQDRSRVHLTTHIFYIIMTHKDI